MKSKIIGAALALVCSLPLRAEKGVTAMAIHGGAGVRREELGKEKEAACRVVLKEALMAGQAVLIKGGRSLEAVKAAIIILEDSPLFNAGRGSVLNADGEVEMDASLMDGETLAAGAVAGVTGVRNPVLLAEVVMKHTPHVMMIGPGAEALARQHGLRFEESAWFITPEQREKLERVKKSTGLLRAADYSLRMGTVGAVALDAGGHLAAGTSTGGLTNKRSGRVGDSPIIGAGTYAEDKVCAVSCTGHGEFFIRNSVAHDVAARMKYGGTTLTVSADAVVQERLKSQKGMGGLIAVDDKGNIKVSYNTTGMFRAWFGADGVPHVAVFGD